MTENALTRAGRTASALLLGGLALLPHLVSSSCRSISVSVSEDITMSEFMFKAYTLSCVNVKVYYSFGGEAAPPDGSEFASATLDPDKWKLMCDSNVWGQGDGDHTTIPADDCVTIEALAGETVHFYFGMEDIAQENINALCGPGGTNRVVSTSDLTYETSVQMGTCPEDVVAVLATPPLEPVIIAGYRGGGSASDEPSSVPTEAPTKAPAKLAVDSQGAATPDDGSSGFIPLGPLPEQSSTTTTATTTETPTTTTTTTTTTAADTSGGGGGAPCDGTHCDVCDQVCTSISDGDVVEGPGGMRVQCCIGEQACLERQTYETALGGPGVDRVCCRGHQSCYKSFIDLPLGGACCLGNKDGTDTNFGGGMVCQEVHFIRNAHDDKPDVMIPIKCLNEKACFQTDFEGAGPVSLCCEEDGIDTDTYIGEDIDTCYQLGNNEKTWGPMSSQDRYGPESGSQVHCVSNTKGTSAKGKNCFQADFAEVQGEVGLCCEGGGNEDCQQVCDASHGCTCTKDAAGAPDWCSAKDNPDGLAAGAWGGYLCDDTDY